MAGSSWDESRCANPAGGDRRKFEYGPEQMLPLSTGRGGRARARASVGARGWTRTTTTERLAYRATARTSWSTQTAALRPPGLN